MKSILELQAKNTQVCVGIFSGLSVCVSSLSSPRAGRVSILLLSIILKLLRWFDAPTLVRHQFSTPFLVHSRVLAPTQSSKYDDSTLSPELKEAYKTLQDFYR